MKGRPSGGLGQRLGQRGEPCEGLLHNPTPLTRVLDGADFDAGRQVRRPVAVGQGAAARVREAEEAQARARVRPMKREPGGEFTPRGARV